MLKQLQRHTDFGNQKYRNYIQPANQDVFEIFNDRLASIDPLWYTKEILDFGCNVGHLLGTSDGKIDPKKYTGIDVHRESIEIARAKFPDAAWIHYNGYNSTFNPKGKKNATFKITTKPDIIIVYGVFTHCDFAEITRQLAKLKPMLAKGGMIVFSIWEDAHLPGYLGFLKTCFGLSPISDIKFKTLNFNQSLYLINRDEIIIDKDKTGIADCEWLETFYNRDYILKSIDNVKFLNGIYSHHSIFMVENNE